MLQWWNRTYRRPLGGSKGGIDTYEGVVLRTQVAWVGGRQFVVRVEPPPRWQDVTLWGVVQRE